jgi:uncharacterized membrane protein
MVAFQQTYAMIAQKITGIQMIYSKICIVSTVLTCGIASNSTAQELAVPILPAVFEVTGLQAGNHLNVRSAPSAKAGDIGDLQLGAKVEVTAIDPSVGWAQIVYGEWTAWVYARYLEPVGTALMTGTDLPADMTCGGTEPFWSMSIANGATVQFTKMGEPAGQVENITYAGKSPNHILRQGLQTASWSAFIEKRKCSDGMSDRQMGISIELMSTGKTPAAHYSGCCSLVTVGQ